MNLQRMYENSHLTTVITDDYLLRALAVSYFSDSLVNFNKVIHKIFKN